MHGNKNKALIEGLPIICILLVWTPQYVYRAFYEDRTFYEFDSGIYFLISSAILAYILGCFDAVCVCKR